VLFFLGGLGVAGVVMLLWPATSYAETPQLPVDAVTVIGQPITPVVVPDPVVDAVGAAPIAGPLVTEVADQAQLDSPIPLPIPALSDVLAPPAPQPADPSIGSHSVSGAQTVPTQKTASTTFARSRAAADADAARHAKPTTTASLTPAGTAGSQRAPAVWAFGGGPSALAADAQTKLRGDTSAASIAAVARARSVSWKRIDVISSQAARPGVARDLSPPG
jgi:hypothetical protein